jgi:WD40 repeat protein
MGPGRKWQHHLGPPFVQLWQQMFSPDGSRLAAIVAPSYGRWTVAVDGVPWPATFTKLVTDATFSPDGQRIAALAKEEETFRVVVDGSPWSDAWDMAWKPVFSPDGKDVAAKVEKKGQYTYTVNNRVWSTSCDAAWPPVFSPDGSHLMLRTIEAGSYIRRIVPVSTITG